MLKIGFSNAFLKHFALATMLIDHIGIAFFPTNIVFRIIGRSSFVLFCFLLAEGATYTHNRFRYFLRLIAFAFISFVPFSLFGYNVLFCTWHLNVFFVLAFSVVMISLFDYVKKLKFYVSIQIVILIFLQVLAYYFTSITILWALCLWQCFIYCAQKS